MSKTPGFNIKIQGDKGDTPEQTLAKTEKAVAEAKRRLVRQKELESNPLVKEWQALIGTTELVKKQPRSGKITKRKTAAKKTKASKTAGKDGRQPKIKKRKKTAKAQPTSKPIFIQL